MLTQGYYIKILHMNNHAGVSMVTAYIEHLVSTGIARSYGDKLHPYLETKYQSSSSVRTWNRKVRDVW